MSRRHKPRPPQPRQQSRGQRRFPQPTPVQRLPWLERTAALRDQWHDAPHSTGLEVLRLLEDWLYERALRAGLSGYSGMREYVDYLFARQLLSEAESATLRRYIEVRNCLAHRAGLLVSPALAEELLDFSERLFRGGAPDARHLMSSRITRAHPTEALGAMRDRMLREGISRVPVVEERRAIGVLTNRDLLAVKGPLDALTVGEAMQADSLERLLFIAPDAPYDEVVRALREPAVSILLVTEGGSAAGALLGLITVSDILPKL